MHKISSKELFVFAFFLGNFLFPGFGNSLILKGAKNSSIIACIIGFIIGIFFLLTIIYMFKNNEYQNIFQFNKKHFKILGDVLNVLLVLCAIYMIVVSVWSITTFTISQYLIRTSYYSIIIIISFIIALLVLKKIEVIGRTSIILFMFFIVLIVFSAIFLIPLVEFENFMPVFDVSKSSLFKTSIFYPIFSCLPFICLLAINKDDIDDKNKITKRILLGYLASGLVIIGFIILIIGVFGIDISVIFTYPEYTLFKKINAFDFIQRIENIIAIVFFLSAIISLGLLFHFVQSFIIETFKISDNKKINIITVILCFVIPILTIYVFQNYLIIDIFSNYPKYAKYMFIILIFNFILFILFKKKLTKKS